MDASPLQQHFPLGPKKFWKKMWSAALWWAVILGLAFFIGIIMIASVTGQSSRNPFVLHDIGVLIFVLCVVFFVAIIFQGLYVNAYIRKYYYSADDNFITIKKGVFAPTEIHVQYQKIQDVYVDQDIPDRMMGLYDVHIASATVTSGIEAHIDGVEKEAAEGLKAMFLSRISSGGSDITPPVSSLTTSSSPQIPSISLAENISNQNYPITSRWLILSYISTIVVGVIMFFVGLMFWAFLSFQGISAKAGISDNLAVGLTMAVVILLTLISMFTTYLWKKNFRFELTSGFIYCYKGIISNEEKRMPYTTVQDVTVSQSIVERIFGLASVKIKNAATETLYSRNSQQIAGSEGITIPGQYIDVARKLADLIKNIVLTKNPGRTGI